MAAGAWIVTVVASRVVPSLASVPVARIHEPTTMVDIGTAAPCSVYVVDAPTTTALVAPWWA